MNSVSSGKEIIIAKARKPVSCILPITEKLKKRLPGTAKGRIVIKDSFFEPVPDDLFDEFER